MKVLDKIIFDAKVSDRKILWIPASTIVGTPYNPSARTKDGVKFRKLCESIKTYGVIQPLVIPADRDLVDGNRRLAAAKQAGLIEVECIILPMNVDKDKAFREVNTNSENIGGKGWLDACRKGYRTPPQNIHQQYEELFKLVGTYGVDLLISKNLGLNILAQCKGIKALGVTRRLDEIIIKVAEKKLTNKVNAVSRLDIGIKEKVAAIEELLK
jgi:hypothetical protein